MLRMESVVSVVDNTGVSRVKCISVLGKGRRHYANMGDIVIVSIIQVYPKKYQLKSKKLSIGKISRALVLRSNFFFLRSNGFFFRFFDSAVMMLTKKYKPYGNRIFGPILRDLCWKYKFLGAMSKYII